MKDSLNSIVILLLFILVCIAAIGVGIVYELRGIKELLEELVKLYDMEII